MPAKRTYKTSNGLPKAPPDYLGRQAKVTWRKLVHALGDVKQINESDLGLIEMYTTQYETYREAYKHIQENGNVKGIWRPIVNPVTGDVIETVFQGYKRNPSTAIMNECTKNMIKLGEELGLTPKGRRELMKYVDDDKDESSSAAEIMKLFG